MKILKDILTIIIFVLVAILGWFLVGVNPFTGKMLINKELFWGVTWDHIAWALFVFGFLWSIWVMYWYVKDWKEGWFR